MRYVPQVGTILLSIFTISIGFGQAVPTATRTVTVDAFADTSSAWTNYGRRRNLSVTAGADVTFLGFRTLALSLDVGVNQHWCHQPQSSRSGTGCTVVVVGGGSSIVQTGGGPAANAIARPRSRRTGSPRPKPDDPVLRYRLLVRSSVSDRTPSCGVRLGRRCPIPAEPEDRSEPEGCSVR